MDTRSYWVHQKGAVRIGYEFEFIDQDQPRIGTHRASVGEISGHHDEQRTINRVHRFLTTWGATDRLSLDVALPVISRSHRHIHNHQGAPIPMGWDFSGMGDLALQARYAFYLPEEKKVPTLSAIVGGEFPTGSDEEHNETGDHAEPSITPGSGSYDGLVGLSSLQHFSVPMVGGEYALMPLFVSVTYKINGKGHDDYLLGNMLSANLGATYPIFPRIGLMTQLNFLMKKKDGAGTTHEEVEKTGGEYLYVSPGLLMHITDNLDWSSIVQLPIQQRVNEIQLTSDYNLLTGISYRFIL